MDIKACLVICFTVYVPLDRDSYRTFQNFSKHKTKTNNYMRVVFLSTAWTTKETVKEDS